MTRMAYDGTMFGAPPPPLLSPPLSPPGPMLLPHNVTLSPQALALSFAPPPRWLARQSSNIEGRAQSASRM